MKIKYIKQPTEFTCGQTCVSMITNYPIEWIQAFINRDGTSSARTLSWCLRFLGVNAGYWTCSPHGFTHFPKIAILRVAQPYGGHFVLKYKNKIYDPYDGIYTLRGFKSSITQLGYYVNGYIKIYKEK